MLKLKTLLQKKSATRPWGCGGGGTFVLLLLILADLPVRMAIGTASFQAQAQDIWMRLPLEVGGVGEDLQHLYREPDIHGNRLADTIWSANMEGALFQCAWNGSRWGDWTEIWPGMGMLGVDAIQFGADLHLLAGSGFDGCFYEAGPSISRDEWSRPHVGAYPHPWKRSRILDVAFYWPVNGNPPDPENQYFVILEKALPGQLPGIYQWTGLGFDRVDANSDFPGRSFGHFWRDWEDPNVIYTLSHRNEREDGDFYKFSGGYVQSSPGFQVLPVANETTAWNIREALSFTQGWSGADLYSYVLAKWEEIGREHFSVFVTDDLPGGAPIRFECLLNVPPAYTPSRALGMPYTLSGQTYHALWIATGRRYGIYFYDTRTRRGRLVNGDGLTCFDHRAFLPEPRHVPVGFDMSILMGTHKQGVWQLVYDTNDIENPICAQLNAGYKAIDIRSDFKLVANGSHPDIYVPGWSSGLYKFAYSGGNYRYAALAGAEENVQTNPFFDHRIECLARHALGEDTYTLFGCSAGGEIFGPDITVEGEDYDLGGLYAISPIEAISEIAFTGKWDLRARRQVTVRNLVNAVYGNAHYLYLTSGILGPEDDPSPPTTDQRNSHWICRHNGASWSDLYELTGRDYENLAIEDLAPHPISPDTFYLGLGNTVAYTGDNSSFDGRIERIHRAQGSWSKAVLWEDPHAEHFYTVNGLAAMEDPQAEDHVLLFWATATLNDLGADAATYWKRGLVWRRYYDSQTQSYQIDSLYADTDQEVVIDDIAFKSSPAATRVACYEEGGRPVLLASLGGQTTESDLGYRFYLFKWVDGLWTRFDAPLADDVEIYGAATDIVVDESQGNDIYYSTGSSIFKLDQQNGAPAAANVRQNDSGGEAWKTTFSLPQRYDLSQNYPNPCNPQTMIRYELPCASIVKLEIFSISGEKVAILVNDEQPAGFQAAAWDGRNDDGGELANGVYFFRLIADALEPASGSKSHFSKTAKLVLIK